MKGIVTILPKGGQGRKELFKGFSLAAQPALSSLTPPPKVLIPLSCPPRTDRATSVHMSYGVPTAAIRHFVLNVASTQF